MKTIIIEAQGQQWVYDQLSSWRNEITYREILQTLNISFTDNQALFMEEREWYFLLDDPVRYSSIPTKLDSITLRLVDHIIFSFESDQNEQSAKVPLSRVNEDVTVYQAINENEVLLNLEDNAFLAVNHSIIAADKSVRSLRLSTSSVWTVTKVSARIIVYCIEDNRVIRKDDEKFICREHKTVYDVFPGYQQFSVISPSLLQYPDGSEIDPIKFCRLLHNDENFSGTFAQLDVSKVSQHFILVDRNVAWFDPTTGHQLAIYQSVGNITSNSPTMASIVERLPVSHPVQTDPERLAEKEEIDYWNTPFVHLAAPSRSGKTEFAVSLDSFCEYPYYDWVENEHQKKFSACLHFVCSSKSKIYGTPQSIYQDLKASNSFRNFIRDDIHTVFGKNGIGNDQISGSAILEEAGNTGLRSVGLIFKMIENARHGKKMSDMTYLQYDPMSITTFREQIVEVLAPNGLKQAGQTLYKPFIICLDEFNINSGEETPKKGKKGNQFTALELIFIRNLVRELGGIVVLLGTAVSASDFLNPFATGGGSFKDPGPWATIVTRVPPATDRSLEALMSHELIAKNIRYSLTDIIRAKIPTFFHWLWRQDEDRRLVVSCRPGFLGIFFRKLIDTDRSLFKNDLAFFEDIVRQTFVEISKLKNINTTDMGKLGQYLLLFSRNRITNDGRYPDELLHHHFAFVEYSEGDIHVPGPIIECDREKGENESAILVPRDPKIGRTPLTVFSLFPPMLDDELGTIILTSSFGGSRFLSDSAFEATVKAFKAKNLTLRFSGKQTAGEPDRLGLFLEMAATSILISSSHGSLSGTNFIDYLAKVAGEFCKAPETVRFVEMPENLSGSEMIIIPYMSVANETFSAEFRSIPGVNTATYFNTKNQNEYDGIIISDNISNECPLRRSVATTVHEPVEVFIDGKVGMKVVIAHEEKNTKKNTDSFINVPVAMKMKQQCDLVPEADVFLGLVMEASMADMKDETWIEMNKALTGFKFLVLERINGRDIIRDPLADIDHSPVYKKPRIGTSPPPRDKHERRDATKGVCYTIKEEGLEEEPKEPIEQIRYLIFVNGESFSGRPFSSVVTIRPN